MHRFSDEEECSETEDRFEDDGEMKNDESLDGDLSKEINVMAKIMAMIEKQNRKIMWLLSQLLGTLTHSNIEHRDGYTASPLWKRSLRRHCQISSTIPS